LRDDVSFAIYDEVGSADFGSDSFGSQIPNVFVAGTFSFVYVTAEVVWFVDAFVFDPIASGVVAF
jgi:hypothetical protein